MSTARRFHPAGRRWVEVFLVLLIVLGMNVVAAAAPAKTMPGITIESPTAATVSGTITVQAQVPGNPSSVQYKIDARTPVKMKKTADGKWSAPWDTRTVPYGQHTVMVFASGVNYRPLSATVKVTVDNHNPSLTVLKPAEAATVGGSRVALQVRVNEGIPSTTVTYTAGDGTPAPMTRNQTTGLFEATWDTRSLPDGDVTLSFHATDPTGKSADATRTVTIQQPVGQESGDFTHWRGDLMGRAYTAENLGTTFTTRWTNETGTQKPRLAIADGILYAASQISVAGHLSAFNTTTGERIFDLLMEDVISPVAVGPDAAYVTVLEKAVVAVKPDGSTLWRADIPASSAPLVTPDGVLVGDMNGQVYALDPVTGTPRWSVPTNQTQGFMFGYMPVYTGGMLYLPSAGSVLAVDVAARQVAFTINVETSGGLMWDNGLLYVPNEYNLTAFDGLTGEQRWSFQAPYWIETAPAAANGIVLVGATPVDGPTLYALDGATGEVIWSQMLDPWDDAIQSPVVAGNLVYVSGFWGGLKVFDLETGEYQTTLLPDLRTGTPLPYGGMLYVPGFKQGVYALQKQ